MKLNSYKLGFTVANLTDSKKDFSKEPKSQAIKC